MLNKWTFRALMALCGISILISIYDIVTYKAPHEECLINIVMVKHEDMYKQKGISPTYCVPISKD